MRGWGHPEKRPLYLEADYNPRFDDAEDRNAKANTLKTLKL